MIATAARVSLGRSWWIVSCVSRLRTDMPVGVAPGRSASRPRSLPTNASRSARASIGRFRKTSVIGLGRRLAGQRLARQEVAGQLRVGHEVGDAGAAVGVSRTRRNAR